MFIPATLNEARSLGWDRFDIILVSGDAYIDTPTTGAAVIGHWLIKHGFRVGIIAQPDVEDAGDITRLGEPLLWWGITAGALDSMVSNYTSLGRRRNRDDLTPGGENIRRPDRALISYTNLIRRNFKNTVPVILGGVEASLRRIAHYDVWDNTIRRSVLFDAKADVIVYGMGERATLELSQRLRGGLSYNDISGTCCISKEKPEGYIELPSFESVRNDNDLFTGMFRVFYQNTEYPSQGLVQLHGDRYLVQNPPAEPLSPGELDLVAELPYERDVHPLCASRGEVRAIETVRFSITSHRGCLGECNFCSIALHQGRRITSRSAESILRELRNMSSHHSFKGIVSDLGGPTANMYGVTCDAKRPCLNRRCLYPEICPRLKYGHSVQKELLRQTRSCHGVRHVFIASGLRHDMILKDKKEGEAYLRDILDHHISGQLKIAPEHISERVLGLMGKPAPDTLLEFNRLFDRIRGDRKLFRTYYLMAAHPGSTESDMEKLRDFTRRELHVRPEQVQVFTPLPSTWSSVMYVTGRDPFTGERIYVERDKRGREHQKNILLPDDAVERQRSHNRLKKKTE